MHNINGRVALTAVLCRSGHVTDIQVVKGLSYGLTEAAQLGHDSGKTEQE